LKSYCLEDICWTHHVRSEYAQPARAFTTIFTESYNYHINNSGVGIYRYEIIFYFHWVWFEYKLSPPPSQNPVTSRIRLWRSERVVKSYNYMLYWRSRNHGRERTTNYRRCLYSDKANRMNNIIIIIWYSPTVRLNRFYNVQL